jgi:hypothetical protein
VKHTDTFHIEFDTETFPGKIVSTQVTLHRHVTGDRTYQYSVNLSDHPLYPQLAAYVQKNPVKKP